MSEFEIKEIKSLKFCDKNGEPLIDSRDKEPVERKFDISENPLDILRKCTVPYEYWNNELFTQYGRGVSWSSYDKWEWDSKKLDRILAKDLWKMIALCEAHWRNKYQYWYDKQVKEFRDYKREKGDLPKDLGISIDVSNAVNWENF